MRHFAAALVLSLLCACSSRAGESHAPSVRATRARLVVSIVLDQVGTVVLERYASRLPENGLLRRAMREGTFHHRVRYSHANTYTAPGHTVIYTGTTPNESGIMGNRVWDEERRRVVSVVDDGAHPVFSNPSEFASPSVLRVQGVADALKSFTQGRGHVVSLSLKDRCAVLPAGAHPEAAVWYDEDSHRFTTSNYYGEASPGWLETWQSAHPISSYFTTWNLLDASEANVNRDEVRGEGNWHGLGTTFPHPLAQATEPYAAILATPSSTRMLLDLANHAVATFHLGADEQPDLLAISVSGTDYVGHVFGSESLEALDNLVRVDQMLGAFVASLESRVPLAVLITADHGVGLTPETNAAAGHAGVRVQPEEIERAAEAGIDAALGEGVWVDRFVQPFLYLSAQARTSTQREAALAAALEAVRRLPGVHGAYDTRELPRGAQSDDALTRALALSATSDARGDIFVAPARYAFIDEHMPEGSGTSHGTPWEYDTDVPVLMLGVGVSHTESTTPIAATRIAPTLAALLHVTPTRFMRAGALPGVTGN